MTDAARLRVALQEYEEALRRHLDMLREKHDQLAALWVPTREVYLGSGAEVFAEAVERAQARFTHVNDSSSLILAALRARIEALSRFDSPDMP